MAHELAAHPGGETSAKALKTSSRRRVSAPGERAVRSRVLKAKLRAPAKLDHYVRRARLHDLLDEVIRAPVTLVIAPAGAGKTSLLSGWIAEGDAPTAWLTLDDTDRDPAQLWTAIIAALETIAPGCGDQARLLLLHSEDLGAAIEELADSLEQLLPTDSILVLDDVHAIDGDEALASSLARFLHDIPARLHVVLASRLAPRLPLDRVRARGGLGEVHFAELRFSPREAAELLTQLVPSMPKEDVAAIAARVEGWAAGILLSALAARGARARDGSEVPALTADMMIRDYVWHEVLAVEDPQVVQVLLDVAVVDQVGPGLARALTERSDAADVLLRAEARGLLVNRLGPDGWFQVHALVRGALLSELERTSPGRTAEQHARAARWFEAAGEVALALDHLLLAGDQRGALRLLAAREGELYDTGREATIRRIIAALPMEEATADFETMLEFAWCHLLVSRRRFIELVEQLMWWAARTDIDPSLNSRLMVVRSIAATASGRWRVGGELARLAIAALGDSWWQDPFGPFAWNMIAREVALTEGWDDSSDTVREAEMALSREPRRRIAFEGIRALGEALAGRPVDAVRVAAGVRGSVPDVDSMTMLSAEVSTAEAIAHWEIGDRDRALLELEAIAGAPADIMVYCRMRSALELTQAHLDDGDAAAAQRWFTLAETLVEDESLGSDARAWLAQVGTRMALAAGHIDLAGGWAEQVDDRFWGPISVARVRLAVGDRAGARDSLGSSSVRCPRHQVVLALLQARAADEREAALKAAAVAIERAATYGLIQTVVSEGTDILELVEQASWGAPRSWMERLRRAAVRGVRLDPETNHEPLTERERDVLRFLPSRLTLGEIAGELYISLNTLKFHLKVIYRKLEVNSRAEAAEVARRMTASTQGSRQP